MQDNNIYDQHYSRMQSRLQNHREEPGAELWGRIQRDLNASRPKHSTGAGARAWAVAAAAAVLLLAAVAVWQYPGSAGQHTNSPIAEDAKVELQLPGLSAPEVSIAESGFTIENEVTAIAAPSVPVAHGAGMSLAAATTMPAAVLTMLDIVPEPALARNVGGPELISLASTQYRQNKVCETVCNLEAAKNYFCTNSEEMGWIASLETQIGHSRYQDCLCTVANQNGTGCY